VKIINNHKKLPSDLELKIPREEQGKDIWQLVKDTRVLDLNSPYSYLMLCKYFGDTCVAAEYEGRVVGFVSAFRPASDPQVIFVWQVAVDEALRRRRLGMTMLKHLLARESCRQVRYLEITVTPSNQAAYSLYRRLAEELNTTCEESECFPARMFPGQQHEDEVLLRIGPLKE